MKNWYFIFVILSIGIIAPGCGVKVNKTIDIRDGETIRHSLTTVNGNIFIGSECKIRGNCRSVNGIIEVGSNSFVRSIQTVNGRIEIKENVTVSGSIKSVNAPVECDSGVKIRGEISVINGTIDLINTTIGRDIVTYNGDIMLANRSVVRDDIIVRRGRGNSDRHRTMKIEITDDSVVEGDVIVSHADMKVKLILTRGGQVRGRIRNAEVIKD